MECPVNRSRNELAILVWIALLALSVPWSTARAAAAAHQHGVVKLDIAVEGKTLTIGIEAPLDSLVGFETRPRTTAQRQAAEGALKLMNDGSALFRPDAAAQCSLVATTVNAEPLTPAAPATTAAAQRDGHADLEASYAFSCQQPAQLARIEQALFGAFKRIQRIEVQVVGARGQSKQNLKRPATSIKLTP